MSLAVAGLFLVSEPIAGHVIEPVLYGQHTGLSPVDHRHLDLVLDAAMGPDRIAAGHSLDGIVSWSLAPTSKPFSSSRCCWEMNLHWSRTTRLYQRLLAGDDTEAADMAERHLKKQVYRATMMRSPCRRLRFAQTDAARGKLSNDSKWGSAIRLRKSLRI